MNAKLLELSYDAVDLIFFGRSLTKRIINKFQTETLCQLQRVSPGLNHPVTGGGKV